jgi:hypothetical protein
MGHWDVIFMEPRALMLEVTGNMAPSEFYRTVSNFEGQLKAQVLFNPQNPALTGQFVIALIKSTLGKFGEVKAIHSTSCVLPRVKAYLIEFYDTRSAAAACAALNTKDIGVSSLTSNCRVLLLKFYSTTSASSLNPTVTMQSNQFGRTSLAATSNSQA